MTANALDAAAHGALRAYSCCIYEKDAKQRKGRPPAWTGVRACSSGFSAGAKALFACGVSLVALAASSTPAAAACLKAVQPADADYVINGTNRSVVANRDCPNVADGNLALFVDWEAELDGHTALATGDGLADWAIYNFGDVDGAVTGVLNNSVQTGEATSIINMTAGVINGGSFGINSPGALILDNMSEITSDAYIAVKTVQGGDITNREGGVISGGFGPDHRGRTGGGIVNTGDLTVTNAGEIKGKSVGVTNFSPGDATIDNKEFGKITGRFAVSNTGALTLDNSGRVDGSQRGLTNAGGATATVHNRAGGVITSDIDAIRNDGVLTLLDNEGIIGREGASLTSRALLTSGEATVVNHQQGVIRGQIGIVNTGKLTLNNYNTIEGTGSLTGIGIRSASDLKTKIFNHSGATIRGEATNLIFSAARSSSIGIGIDNAGDDISVTNSGVIDGANLVNGIGIRNTGLLTVTNCGANDIDDECAKVDNQTAGEITGASAISNAGKLLALNNGGRIDGLLTGVSNANGAEATITNEEGGVITAGSAAIQNSGKLTLLDNSGVVGVAETGGGDSVFWAVLTSGDATIDNSEKGVIRGRTGIVNTGALTLDNHGTVDGLEGGAGKGASTIGVHTGALSDGFADATVRNHATGRITGDTAVQNEHLGSNMLTASLTLTNRGDIIGSHHFQNSSGGDGPSNTGVVNTGALMLDNFKLIEGTGLGRATGVRTNSVFTTEITNHNGATIKGVVTGDLASSSSPTEMGIGIDNAGDEMTVQNAGAILGSGGAGGVGVRNTGASGAIAVVNRLNGLIDGTHAGVLNYGAISVSNETGATISSQGAGVVNDVLDNSLGVMTLSNAGAINANLTGVSNRGALSFENRGVVNLTSTGVANVDDGRLTLDNYGRIEASGHGVLTDSGGETVVNNFTGGVISGVFGVYGRNGPLTRLDNHGSIIGTNAGVQTERNATVNNTVNGTIFGGVSGIAFVVSPDEAVLDNEGDVEGGSFGVLSTAATTTIANRAGGTISVTNGASGSGVAVQKQGPGDKNGVLIVENAGTVEGNIGVEVFSAGPGFVNDAIIDNLAGGEITGRTNAIKSDGRLTLVNAGKINGHVAAGRFDDTVELRPGFEFTGNVDAAGGEDTLRFSGAGQGDFDVSLIGADRQFRNFERFEKTGDGLWRLGGQYDGDGNFTVGEGELEFVFVNAPNTKFVIEDGATLSGWGYVGALTIARGATVSPSGGGVYPDIGWPTVEGDIVFEAGSVFDVQINEAASDKLTAFGSIDIDPAATLRVSATAALTGAANQYAILQSVNGEISGAFGTVDDSGLPDLDIVLDYTDPQATRLSYTQAASPSLTASAASTPTYSSKEVHPSALMASLDSAERFTGTLVARAAAPGGGSGGALGFAAGADERSSGAWWAPLGAHVQGAGAIPGRDNRAALSTLIFSLENDFAGGAAPFATDLTGAFSRASISDDGLVPGWAAAMGGLVFGVDQDLSEAGLPVRLGFASGFSRSSLDVGASQADIEAWHMGVYAAHRRGAFSLSGAAAYARHSYDFSREVVFGAGARDALSDAEGASFTFAGEAFYDVAPRLGRTGLRLGPVATFGARRASRADFVETGVGVLNLTVEEDAVRQFTTGLGGAVSAPAAQIAGVRVAAEARVVWEHVAGDLNARTTSSIPFADATFTTASAQLSGRNRAAIGLGAAFTLTDALNVHTRYDGRLDDKTADHRLTAGLSWRF